GFKALTPVFADGRQADSANGLKARLEGIAGALTFLGKPGSVLFQQLGEQPLTLTFGCRQRLLKECGCMLTVRVRRQAHLFGQQQIPDPLGGGNKAASVIGNKNRQETTPREVG